LFLDWWAFSKNIWATVYWEEAITTVCKISSKTKRFG